MLSRIEIVAPKCFLKQQCLHLSAFSHNNVCTQVLSHTTMFAPKCNQDQMFTTTSPPFKLIHTFIYAYMYILYLLMNTQLVNTWLQMMHFWLRSSQWTHTFSKYLCACFYGRQLLKLNNFKQKTNQITCDPILDQIITYNIGKYVHIW